MTDHDHHSQQRESLPVAPEDFSQQNVEPISPTEGVSDVAVEETITSPPCKHTIEGLLKSPAWVIHTIETDTNLWRESLYLLGWGVAFHALYGFAIAFFGGWHSAFMTIMKAPVIAIGVLGLCLPSLYIFSCIGGMRVTYSQTLALASCILSMTGLLLLGLAPIAWLFSVSTENIAFPVVLNVIGWLIAVGFAARLLRYMESSKTLHQTIGIKWWMIIYIIVSFQMATTMRPLLEKPENGWWASEKKIFVAHFLQSLQLDEPREDQKNERK